MVLVCQASKKPHCVWADPPGAQTFWYMDTLVSASTGEAGLFGFLSGEFIVSSTLFATAAIASNVNINSQRGEAGSEA